MAYKFSLSCYHKKVLKGGFSKVGGLSIRCIKDEVQNPDKSNDQSSKEDNKVDKNAQVNIAKIDNGHNVIIGTQTWHKTNLDVSTFRNGDTIPEAKTREEWKIAGEKGNPAWCYYENNSTNGQKYGKLYNWYAVSDNRNLAPLGWHIPTDAEWTILTDFLGGERNAGGKVKEAGTNNWAKPNAGSVDDDKATSTNETGLTLLPSGIRTSWLKFDGIGYGGNYWTSTEKDSKNTWSRDLSYIIGNVNKGYWTKKSGLSVRCIKDNL